MMKKLSINLLTNVILLLAGIILILFHGVPNILIWGARVIGAVFMLPAIAYLIMVAVRHADARTSADYMGVLLVVLGLFHVIFLLLSRSSLIIKGWYHICPLIVVLCGILSLAVPALRQNVSTVVLVTGICLLLFNFTSLQEYLAERRARKALARPSDEAAPANETVISTNESIVETPVQDDEIE